MQSRPVRHDPLAGYPAMLSIPHVAEIMGVARATAQQYLEQNLREHLINAGNKYLTNRRWIISREILRQALHIPEPTAILYNK